MSEKSNKKLLLVTISIVLAVLILFLYSYFSYLNQTVTTEFSRTELYNDTFGNYSQFKMTVHNKDVDTHHYSIISYYDGKFEDIHNFTLEHNKIFNYKKDVFYNKQLIIKDGVQEITNRKMISVKFLLIMDNNTIPIREENILF